MADDKPTEKPAAKTAADVIDDDDSPRRRRRSAEERCAFLEDENSNLKGRVNTLEGALKEISDSLKSKPSSNGKSNLWKELEDLFNW